MDSRSVFGASNRATILLLLINVDASLQVRNARQQKQGAYSEFANTTDNKMGFCPTDSLAF